MSFVFLPLFISIILVALVMPLQPEILDILLVVNLSFACLLLFTSIYISSNLKLTSLPSLLLLATLFRVSLNVSTTRSVLTDGTAGKLIDFFGHIVIGNNLLVGIVIFIIITLMQFLVIAKGSERTAEVSARFSLDALPGKQIAIDSDLRSGIITIEQSRDKREELQIESKFFASLDGAMKFIKGDVILGILITLVNLIVGIINGYIKYDLELLDLINKYTSLAIGDALVSQIPSLLNALTAGLIISRVEVQSKVQANIIISEIFQSIEAKLILSILLLIFSFVPGIPLLVTIPIGIFFFISVLLQLNKQNKNKGDLIFNDLEADIKIISSYKINIENIENEFYNLKGFKIRIKHVQSEDSKILIYFKNFLVKEYSSQVNELDLLKSLISISHELLDDNSFKDLVIEKRNILYDKVNLLVPSQISSVRLLKILKLVLSEDLSLKQIDIIIDVIHLYVNEKDDRIILSEIRIALRREISLLYAKNYEIRAAVIDSKIENEISSGNTYEAFSNLAKQIIQKENIKLLITSKRVRTYLSDFLKSVAPNIRLIAFEEIDINYKVISDEIITLS